MKKNKLSRLMAYVLTFCMLMGMFSAAVSVSAAEGSLPIYFFISRPGEEPSPSGNYEDYDVLARQGSALSTPEAATNSQIATNEGIRNVSPESLITDFVESWPSGYTLESFKKFGTMELWREEYKDTEYEITWVTICKRGTGGLNCYCGFGIGAHIHIDGVLSKIVEVDEDTLKITKTIPEAAPAGGKTFNFKLYKLKHNDEFVPIDEIDTNFEAIDMKAEIEASQTSATILASDSSSVPELSFGYYQLVEESDEIWAPQSKLYIQVATNGSIKYSNALRTTSFVEMADGATFANTRRKYTVTYKDGIEGRSFVDRAFTGINYGSATPAFPDGTPEYPDKTYIFDGWFQDKDNDGIKDSDENAYAANALPATVTEDAVYVALWKDNAHTVTWMDVGGVILETDENVINGTLPTYDGGGGSVSELAALKNTAQYTYEFNGWTPQVTAMAGQDQIYVATYKSSTNKYTVRWIDYDDSELEVDADVEYNTFPTYDGGGGTYAELAAARNDAEWTYTFSKWSPVPAVVVGDITYKAEYTRVKNTYQVKWEDFNGRELELDPAVEYGDTPSYDAEEPGRPDTARYTYTFTGWKVKGQEGESDPSYNTGSFPDVTGNVTYVAQYTATQIKFTGTVNVHLDNEHITSPVTLETLIGSGMKMYLGNGEQGEATQYYELTQSQTDYHKFINTQMENGNYYIYISDDESTYTQICEQILVIENADRERDSFFWSVTYNGNGATTGVNTDPEYYHNEFKVNVNDSIPEMYGYVFSGWLDDENDNGVQDPGEEIFNPGDVLTSSITRKYVLVALWEEAVDLNVNVVIDHTSDAGRDIEDTKDDVQIELLSRANSTGLWLEVPNTILNFTSDPCPDTHYFEFYPFEATTLEDYETSRYTANTVTYDGTTLKLRRDYEYTLTAVKSGYELDTAAAAASGETVVTDGITRNGDTLTVYLKYAPDDFDLEFSLRVLESVPDEAIPDAAIVRVYHYNSGWKLITQHEEGNPGVNVAFVDAQGNKTRNASGSITVPATYDYRIAVSAFVYDGKIVPATTPSSGAQRNDVYTDGIYTADLGPINGGHKHGQLYGAYYDSQTSSQVGVVDGEITIGLHNVIFDAKGGTIENGPTYTLSDQWKTPDPDGYTPTRTGGYVFDGWYEDETYTTPARKDIRLSSDVTFYAKWINPITVKGTIYVDGTYESGTKTINDSDRIKNVTVLLQRHIGNNRFQTRRTASVTITYDQDGNGTGTYEFADIPNDEVLRVSVLNHNYDVTYNNEAMASDTFGAVMDNATTCPSVALDEDANSIANVNVKMTFEPEDFTLSFKVIATAIGEGFRPDNAEVLVLYDDNFEDTASPRTWPVISQMRSGTGEFNGYEVTLALSGSEYSGTGTYSVWQRHPLGYAYDYAIDVEAVDQTDLDGNEPFTVEYNGTAQYADPGQTQLLTATLRPKTYPINYYIEQGSTIKIETMEKKTHTWSFATDISGQAAPVRRGYVFKEWVDESGNTITVIPAGNKETNVYAVWDIDEWRDSDKTADPDDKDSPIGGDGIPDYKQVHIVYESGENGTTTPIGEIYTIDGASYSDITFTATSGSTPILTSGYAVDEWTYIGSDDNADNATASFTPDVNKKIVPTITNADGGKTYTFKVTFDKDEKGGNNGPDGIADKYQAFVEFVSGNVNQGQVTPNPISANPNGTIYQVFNFGDAQTGTVTPDVSKIDLVPAQDYAFAYWTQDTSDEKLDAVPASIDNVAGGTTIVFHAHFAIDEWNATSQSDDDGDDIPDYKQVLIKYIPTTNSRGTVTGEGAVQVFNIPMDVNGEYKGSVDPSDASLTVTPNTGWAFDYWGDVDNFWGGGAGSVLDDEKPFALHENVQGGQTITYVAHFAEDHWKDDGDNDSTESGDGTPDHKQILVEYFSENTAKGTVTNPLEVITLTTQTVYNPVGSTAVPSQDNAFDRWRYIQDYPVTYDSTSLQINPVINNPVGGSRYSFYASFDTDIIAPDGVPDKYQAYVEFVSEDAAKGTVSGTGIKQVFVFKDTNGNYTYTGSVTPDLTNVAVSPAPNYVFSHWTIDNIDLNLDDAQVQQPIENVAAERTITIKAHFVLAGGGGVPGGGGGSTRYTLTYNTNGGSDIPNETHTSGNTVKLTKEPEKEGYIFDGWHLDTELTEDVTEVRMTKHITVYAAWVEDNGNAGNGHPTPGVLNGQEHFAYVIGYPDGTVRPDDNITRAEVTSIFFRLLKEEIREANLTQLSSYGDVVSGDWFNTAIATMTKLGIVKGRYEGKFVPDANITRAEFAVICARFDDSEFEIKDDFADVDGHWAESEIHEAAAHGWIRGYEDNTFKPDQYITRAEAMTMINRVLNRIPEKASDLLPDMIKWADNSNTNEWYYIAIQEATNSHEYEMKNSIYEVWTKLTGVEDWAAYAK